MASEKLMFAQSVEALFIRALGPYLTREGRQRLKAVGLDLSEPLRPQYTLEQWRGFLRVAARDVFPELPPHEASFALGARFLQGFRQTSVGRASMQLVTQLGPQRTLERVPYNVRAGNNFNEVRVEESTKDSATLWMKDVTADTPDFAAGFLAETLRSAGAGQVKVEPIAFDGTAATFRVTWTKAAGRAPVASAGPRRIF
ncbi:TIGR02265 family protein [Myxococcus hansupus]